MTNILFVTRRTHPVTLPTISPTQAREIVRSWISSPILVHDIETTGQDPYINTLLLEAWWNGDPTQPLIVIDATSVRTEEVITNEDVKDKRIIAHSGDFEARWALKRGLTEGRYYCTLVAERTILSGANNLKYDLISCLERRGITVPPDMDKSIRLEFIGKDSSFEFHDRHIRYNASDCWKLAELMEKQQIHIDKLGMNFLIHGLRSPLIKILAACEITGFVHNARVWADIAKRREEQAAVLRKWLDDYVVAKGVKLLDINKKLAEEYEKETNRRQRISQRLEKITTEIAHLQETQKTHLKAYGMLSARYESLQEDLLIVRTLEEPCINWSSSSQPLEALKALEIFPLPQAKDQKTQRLKVGVGKAARTNWFAENENHEQKAFMKKFDEFKKIEHNIKSFGEAWTAQYTNAVTGKVHTILRQTGTRTGRFASGDKRIGYFNIQQIPGYKNDQGLAEYRVCFGTDPGRSVTTLDYIGCEIVCMISLSGDLELKKISELPDQHSYMGTKCWRAIYADRYERTKDPKWAELAETYVMDKNTREGDKARKKFKESGVFPVIYGVRESKVASVQGFTPHEGGIFIKTIEGEMPNVVSFVKEKAQFALRKGYVLHNTRTNSRRWFMPVLDEAMYDIPMSNKDRTKIDNAARNSPIQGTNVDIIIEAIVTIARWAKLYKVDVRLLGQVHDELIYDHPSQDTWIPAKLKEIMKRVAQNYLIKEISMDVDCHTGDTWNK